MTLALAILLSWLALSILLGLLIGRVFALCARDD